MAIGNNSYNLNGADNYLPVGVGTFYVSSLVDVVQVPFYQDGTLSNFRLFVSTHTVYDITETRPVVVSLFKNGVDTGVLINIAPGATGQFENSSDTISITSGDYMAISVTGPVDGSSIATLAVNIPSFSVQFKTTIDSNMQKLVTSLDTTASTTIYVNPAASSFVRTTEAATQLPIPIEGSIIKNLYVYVGVNGRTSSSTITLNVDGTPSALTVTIPAGQTDVFLDTAHTITLPTIDSKISYKADLGSEIGFSLVAPVVTCELYSSNGKSLVVGSFNDADFAASTTYYGFVSGNDYQDPDNEAFHTQTIGYEFNADRISANIEANTTSGNGSITFRSNSQDLNGYAISIPDTSGSLVQDVYSTASDISRDFIKAGDNLTYKIATDSGTTALKISCISMAISSQQRTNNSTVGGTLIV